MESRGCLVNAIEGLHRRRRVNLSCLCLLACLDRVSEAMSERDVQESNLRNSHFIELDHLYSCSNEQSVL